MWFLLVAAPLPSLVDQMNLDADCDAAKQSINIMYLCQKSISTYIRNQQCMAHGASMYM
jgi:hypothetical protein